VIAEAIDRIGGSDVFEFGCGGTTEWILENTHVGKLTTVDNDRKWLQKCIEEIDPFWRVTGRWVPRYVPLKVGANATIGEEHPDGEDPYWYASERYADECLSDEFANIFIVDGVTRGKCLTHIVNYHANREHCTIFIHDTQRDWYDDAIAEAVAAGFERTDYPEGEDYPGCLLTRLTKG
jgi:hypothetical protein